MVNQEEKHQEKSINVLLHTMTTDDDNHIIIITGCNLREIEVIECVHKGGDHCRSY